MTNSQKASLVQQYSGKNRDRIRDLRSEGYRRQEAEEIDSLERREAILNELGAAGELTADQRDELDTVQSHLHELVGSPHTTYVGTSFPDHAGDGQASGTPTLDVDRPTCPQCGGEGSADVSHARGTDTHVCPWCKGAGTLTPPRMDLPYLRIKSAIPLSGGVWRVSYRVKCYSNESDGFWRLQGPLVKGRASIHTALWKAHEKAARRFQADAQQHAQEKANRLASAQRLHEASKRDAATLRADVEAQGHDWDVYAGIRP
jgi:hypothetical protein